MTPKSWRTDSRLSGYLHPRNRDEVQVLIHDGSPYVTSAQPEKIWVKLLRAEGELYRGQVLGQPQQLISVGQGSEIWLKPTPRTAPIFLPESYMQERPYWHIQPCEQCGLDDLFDAPSELIYRLFPHVMTEKQMRVFATTCPLCGGMQIVENKAATRYH